VKKAKVSFKEKTGWVVVDDAVTDEQLLEAVKKAGPYTGEVRSRSVDKP